jgi:hypothetical protein
VKNNLCWYGIDLSGSKYGPTGGFCEDGDELPASIKHNS